jgi:DnaJ-class molecular chaperone
MELLGMRQVYVCSVCGTDIGWAAPSGVCSEECLRNGQGFSEAQLQALRGLRIQECPLCDGKGHVATHRIEEFRKGGQ